MKNFPFQKDGKTYWYSRAIVCVSTVFCKDNDMNIYVLANQRGTATDKEVGKWNLPVGFLDFNETTAQCAAREIFEETGVRVAPKALRLHNINSKPDDGSQDVGFRYYAQLPGTIDQYPTNTRNMEKNEVVVAKWINIEQLDDYTWAWNHRDIISEIAKKVFGAEVLSPAKAKEICYKFKCDDGVRVDVFGTTEEYGHVDYADCATYSKPYKDTARNNFIRAYKEICSLHRVRPMTMDKLLKSVIAEVGEPKTLYNKSH